MTLVSQYWQFGDGKAYTTGYTYNADGTLNGYNGRYYQATHSYDSLLRLQTASAPPKPQTV